MNTQLTRNFVLLLLSIFELPFSLTFLPLLAMLTVVLALL
jgi:hypothetical protein